MRMHTNAYACMTTCLYLCGMRTPCLIAVVCLSHMLALFLELWEPDTLTSMVISQIICPLGFLFVGFNLYFMFQIKSLYVVQYGLSSDHPDSASSAVRTTVYISMCSGDSRRSFSRENKTFSQETKPSLHFPPTPEMERLDYLLTFPSSLGVRVVMWPISGQWDERRLYGGLGEVSEQRLLKR